MIGYCPYCKAELVPVPRRKKKCPECGQTMYVRDGKLLQEYDAFMEDWLNFLSPLNVKKRDFDRTRKELEKQFGKAPGFFDVVWSILNGVILEGSPEKKIYAYLEMARVARSEGKDPTSYIAESQKTGLEEMKRRGVRYVKINNYGSSPDYSTCPGCAELHGQVLPIDEAIMTQPVPNKCTNNFGCRCEYLPA